MYVKWLSRPGYGIILGQSRINTAFAEFCRILQNPCRINDKVFFKAKLCFLLLSTTRICCTMKLDRNNKLGKILIKLALLAFIKSQITGEHGMFRSTMTGINQSNHCQTQLDWFNSEIVWQTAEMYILTS